MMNDNMMRLLGELAILFPAFLAVFTIRGFFSALVARWFGDDTAYQEGFLTLNPTAHVHIFGLSIMLLIVFLLGGLFGGGFTRSMLYMMLIILGVRWSYHAPFDARKFRNMKLGVIMTVLAGSLGCFLLVYVSLCIIKYVPFASMSLGASKTLMSIVGATISLASYFGILTLLPFPPFYGGQILQYILPYSKQWIVEWLEEYSLFILLALFVVPFVSDVFFGFISLLSSGIVLLLAKLVF